MDLVTAASLAGALLVTLLAVTFGYFVILLLLVHAKYDHLPGPKRTSFFLGNAADLTKSLRSPEDSIKLPEDLTNIKPIAHEAFTQWFEVYGDTYTIYVLHKVIVVTRHRNILKRILVDGDQRDFPKGEEFSLKHLYGQRFIGEGLVSACDHDAWYLRRRVMDPMFHRNHLKSAVATFNSAGDNFLKDLQTYAESGDSCGLSHLIEKSTLDVIMKILFSAEIADVGADFHELVANFIKESFAALQMSGMPLVQVNPLLYSHRLSIRKIVKSFREIGAKKIAERKAAICSGEAVPDDLLTAIIKGHLDPSTGYDFETLVDEFVGMIVAGMETSSNTLAFTFMELGRRPDLLQRLVTEVDEVVGQKSFISNEDITRLSFTSMLIKETLRRYAIAPSIMRVVRKETTIDGIRLPAGTPMMLSIMGANNDRKYIDDPDKFDPDRFHPEQTKRISVYSFLSFSLGLRNCIGQVFAQMEMKVMLAKFFQHFTLQLDSSETFHLGQRATLFPISGVKCKILSRE